MLKKGGFKKIISETQSKKQEEEGLSRKKSKKKNPCWKGYEAIGMKKKGGKTVPNCVPKKKKK